MKLERSQNWTGRLHRSAADRIMMRRKRSYLQSSGNQAAIRRQSIGNPEAIRRRLEHPKLSEALAWYP